MIDRMRFWVRPAWVESPFGYSIYCGAEYPDGRRAFVMPAQMRIFPAAKPSMPDPMLIVEDKASLQSLMDELWKEGVRPSDIGTPGHLAATQAHLSDMRKLVEKTLDTKL